MEVDLNPEEARLVGESSKKSKKQVPQLPFPVPVPALQDSPLSLYVLRTREVESALENLTKFLVSSSQIVSDPDAAGRIVSALLSSKRAVAVDCEGVNLGDKRSGKVTLIQFSDLEGNVYLFDVGQRDETANLGVVRELRKVLESEDVVKIMHDCQCDCSGLHKQFGLQLSNVFDTQVAHRVIHKNKKKEEEKLEANVGLEKVVRTYGGALLGSIKESVKGIYRKQQNFWERRPLSELMICYAAGDVLSLVSVYDQMRSELDSLSEEETLAFSTSCRQKALSPSQEKEPGSKKSMHSQQNGTAPSPGNGHHGQGGQGHGRRGGYRGRGGRGSRNNQNHSSKNQPPSNPSANGVHHA